MQDDYELSNLLKSYIGSNISFGINNEGKLNKISGKLSQVSYFNGVCVLQVVEDDGNLFGYPIGLIDEIYGIQLENKVIYKPLLDSNKEKEIYVTYKDHGIINSINGILKESDENIISMKSKNGNSIIIPFNKEGIKIMEIRKKDDDKEIFRALDSYFISHPNSDSKFLFF